MTLPPLYRQLRNHVGTIANALDVVEQCDQRQEWGLDDPATTRERALKTIEQRMIAACELIALQPAERHALVQQIARLKAENARLQAANVQARERV
ncbi:hypothetical protein [Gemmatimonas sp.]|uniref:hypothetical protein n=1 Tax=Gemmatimonas sp. TaxID=1962908 RepID=UPI0025B8CE8B|nr:hypothetical protein [Gemmatimonas sp.]MCA2991175.1 hypothetical protein [Gemmatimonas sp.]